jgi:hypothetical protein
MRIVDRIGLRYDGDAIGGAPGRTDASGRPLRHWRIPVTLCGPRTVPFLEWHGARGTADETILEELDRHLEANSLTVLYGHPCYEGVRAGLPARCSAGLDRGFRLSPTRRSRTPMARSRREGPRIRVRSVFGTRPEAVKMARSGSSSAARERSRARSASPRSTARCSTRHRGVQIRGWTSTST